MAIYMKFGATKGDVSTTQYKDWIMVHSFQFGVGRGISSAAGSGANRQGSHASVSEVTIAKSLDPASLEMFSNALMGKLDTKVEFAFTIANDKNDEYLHITLTDTGISGYSLSSGGDRPSESVSLNFAKIEYKEITLDDKGGAAKPQSKIYDLMTHKLS